MRRCHATTGAVDSDRAFITVSGVTFEIVLGSDGLWLDMRRKRRGWIRLDTFRPDEARKLAHILTVAADKVEAKQ